MIINSFSIRKLFGLYSYEFALNKSQNLFMITGPNGYGKTTILTIINALSQKNLFYFYQFPFEKIIVGLDNKQLLEISSFQIKSEEAIGSDKELSSKRQIEFKWYQENSILCKFLLDEKSIRKAARNVGFYRGSYDDFRDLMSDSFIQFISNNTRIYDLLAKEQGQELFLMLLSSIPSTFIKAQRLFSLDKPENASGQESSIETVQEKLRQRMYSDYINYLQKSQQKDSKFIDTLLSSKVEYSETDYNNKIVSLIPQMEELHSYGLINMGIIKEYNSDNSKILSAYIKDLEDKIQVYTKSVEKLRLFSLYVYPHKHLNFALYS